MITLGRSCIKHDRVGPCQALRCSLPNKVNEFEPAGILLVFATMGARAIGDVVKFDIWYLVLVVHID